MLDFRHHKSFKQCALFIAMLNFRVIQLAMKMVNHNACILDSTSIHNEMKTIWRIYRLTMTSLQLEKTDSEEIGIHG